MSLKLLKIRAIMQRFNCSEEEAIAIQKTGVAPKQVTVAAAVVETAKAVTKAVEKTAEKFKKEDHKDHKEKK